MINGTAISGEFAKRTPAFDCTVIYVCPRNISTTLLTNFLTLFDLFMQHPVEAYLFNNITSPLFALILARSHKKRLNLGGDRVETGSSRNGGDAGGFHAGGRVYGVDRTP